MKRFLMAAIAVLMLAAPALAAEKAVEVNVLMTQKENVIDKLIALINNYTKKVNAVKTADELLLITEQCYADVMEFNEKYENELITLEKTLTEEQMAAYETKLEKALANFEAAVEKKTEELIGDYEFE